MSEEGSLYDRIGGESAIIAACSIFYARLIEDPLLRGFFDGMDVEALTAKQIGFLTHAFNGPKEYRGRPLNEAHARLVRESGLSEIHFDRTVMHLNETLAELGVADSLIAEVAVIVESTRNDVLGRR